LSFDAADASPHPSHKERDGGGMVSPVAYSLDKKVVGERNVLPFDLGE